MRIDPKIERLTREMLDHAMRGGIEEIEPRYNSLNHDERRQSLELCLLVAGYIAVDASGTRWPSDAGIRQLAGSAVKAEKRLNLAEEDVYNYVARVVFGFQPLEKVFTDANEAIFAAILITGSLLLTFCPRSKNTVWEYLDEIEAATEAAAAMQPYMFPAVIYRSGVPSEG